MRLDDRRFEKGPWEPKEGIRSRITELRAVLDATATQGGGKPPITPGAAHLTPARPASSRSISPPATPD